MTDRVSDELLDAIVKADSIGPTHRSVAKELQERRALGWQPIATVPHVYDPVDLWHRHDYRVANARWTVNRKRHGGVLETGWTDQSGATIPETEFTHWMPHPGKPS